MELFPLPNNNKKADVLNYFLFNSFFLFIYFMVFFFFYTSSHFQAKADFPRGARSSKENTLPAMQQMGFKSECLTTFARCHVYKRYLYTRQHAKKNSGMHFHHRSVSATSPSAYQISLSLVRAQTSFS